MTRALPLQEGRKLTQLREAHGDRARQDRSKPAPLRGDGQLVEGVEIAATASTRVSHSLKRQHQGWTIHKLKCTGTGGRWPYETEADDTSLRLYNPGADAITLDLYVY